MTAAVRTTTGTVHRAVYRTDCDASVNLCLSQPAWTTRRREENRISFNLRNTEFNCIRLAVNLKRKPLITEDCARCIVLLKLTTDRHEASRGLSATARLLVLFE